MPNYLSLTICPRCESIRVKKRWLGPVGLENAIPIALRPNSMVQGERSFEVDHIELPLYASEARVALTVRGRASEELPEYAESYSLLLRLRWEVCSDCLESHRKILPYKIQLRSDVGHLSRRDQNIADSALNEAVYLQSSRYERKEVEGGLDVKFESPRAAGEMLALLRMKRLGEERRSSEGVLRLPSGGQVVKWTYVFRFLSLEPGEIVHLDEGDVRVEQVRKGRAVITELKTNKRSTLPLQRLFDAKSAPIRE